jgi:hypothetical protein
MITPLKPVARALLVDVRLVGCGCESSVESLYRKPAHRMQVCYSNTMENTNMRYCDGYTMRQQVYKLQARRKTVTNVGDLLQILALLQYILTK